MIGILGHLGRLGSKLVSLGCDALDCDVTNLDQVTEAIESYRGHTVINCAAYTDVDGAETDAGYSIASKVNGLAPGRIKILCDRYDKRLIHLSTDYVFSGKKGPYTEDNLPKDPVNKYGLTKFAGEYALRTFHTKNDITVRTTGLYGGSDRYDFLQLIKNSIGKGMPLSVSDELMGNQTHYNHLAEGLLVLANTHPFPTRMIHIASEEVISRFGFALLIAKKFGYSVELVLPVDNKDIVNWKAKRPSRGGLDVRLAKELGIPIYTIEEGLELECQ